MAGGRRGDVIPGLQLPSPTLPPTRLPTTLTRRAVIGCFSLSTGESKQASLALLKYATQTNDIWPILFIYLG